MKITPAMLEAGVAAMARIKKQKPQDAAVVNTVFSAMYSAMLTEQKRLAGLEAPKPYEHQDWPKWMYDSHGTSRIFDKPDDVPEGWHAAAPTIVDVAIAEANDELRPKRKYTKRAVDGASSEH